MLTGGNVAEFACQDNLSNISYEFNTEAPKVHFFANKLLNIALLMFLRTPSHPHIEDGERGNILSNLNIYSDNFIFWAKCFCITCVTSDSVNHQLWKMESSKQNASFYFFTQLCH